jgi:hypothetical protein
MTLGTRVLRYYCEFTNLRLENEFQVGNMLISPIDEAQDSLKKVSSTQERSLATATGVVPMPLGAHLEMAMDLAQKENADTICLLMSLFSRCYVGIGRSVIQQFTGDEWIRLSEPIRFPPLARVKPRLMRGVEGGIAGFVVRSLPKVISDHENDDKGILRALRFYATTYQRDFSETLYLKIWIAFEILYSRHAGKANILGSSNAKKIRRAFASSVVEMVESGSITEAERDLILEKIPELNRRSASNQALEFIADVLAEYPDLRISEGKIRLFSKVRNEITHMGHPDLAVSDEEYQKRLHLYRVHLGSFVASIMMVLLDEEPDLGSWYWSSSRFDSLVTSD